MKKVLFKDVTDYIVILIGAALAAFALVNVLIPNSILDGGVNGISIIINNLTGFRLSLLVFLINVPFIYIGYRNLGKDFLVKTIFSIVSFSLLLELYSHVDYILTDDHILATVYGSVILGLGVGLIIKSGGCLDGTESIGIVLSKKSDISVGEFVLICNIIIFSVASFFFGIDRALFSMLAYFITSRIVDYLQGEISSTKAALIICENGTSMANKIFNKIGRTCTIMEGNGLITGKKDVLYCVLTRIEVFELKKIVLSQDQKAFITITDVSEIIGNHIKRVK